MKLSKALTLSVRTLRIQDARLRTIAATLANQDARGPSSAARPHRREVAGPDRSLSFGSGDEAVLARPRASEGGEPLIRSASPSTAPCLQEYMRELDRDGSAGLSGAGELQGSGDANLNVMEATRSLLTRTIEMLR